jgi:hypothetical protein
VSRPVRAAGPVFVTERKARMQLPQSDLDATGHARRSYQQAEAIFKDSSGITPCISSAIRR